MYIHYYTFTSNPSINSQDSKRRTFAFFLFFLVSSSSASMSAERWDLRSSRKLFNPAILGGAIGFSWSLGFPDRKKKKRNLHPIYKTHQFWGISSLKLFGGVVILKIMVSEMNPATSLRLWLTFSAAGVPKHHPGFDTTSATPFRHTPIPEGEELRHAHMTIMTIHYNTKNYYINVCIYI